MRNLIFLADSTDSAIKSAPWAARIYKTGIDYETKALDEDPDGNPLKGEGFEFRAFESHVDANNWEGGFEPGDVPLRVL